MTRIMGGLSRRDFMKGMMVGGIAVGSASLLAACGSSASSSSETETENTAVEEDTTAAETTEETTAESTTETEATAQEESAELSGKVVVYMPSPSGLNEKYIADFEKKTGVTVELFEGTTGEILARLEVEEANPVADVVVLASWSDGLSLKETGVLMSYEKSGSCKDFLAGYMYATDEDWSAFEAMAEIGMTVPGANKAALEAVTTGEKAVLVAGVDYNAYSSIAKGEPIDIYYPEFGTVINPRPAMILNTSQNVENAKAFVDYLMSDSAQELVAAVYLLPGRTDITCDSRTNVSDIPTFDIDWGWMMENADRIAAQLNELCE